MPTPSARNAIPLPLGVETVTRANYLAALAAIDLMVGPATTETLTNKTLTAPTITNPSITGTITGAPTINSPVIASPTISGTVSGAAGYLTPTLTNPSINGAASNVDGRLAYVNPKLYIGDGAASHVLVTEDMAETLTNKTLTSPFVSGPIRGILGGGLNINAGAAPGGSNGSGDFISINAGGGDGNGAGGLAQLVAGQGGLTGSPGDAIILSGRAFAGSNLSGGRLRLQCGAKDGTGKKMLVEIQADGDVPLSIATLEGGAVAFRLAGSVLTVYGNVGGVLKSLAVGTLV